MEHRAWNKPRALALAALCSTFASATALAQTVRVDSAAAGRALLEAAAAPYQKQKPGTRIEVGVAGSAGSLAKLCTAEADLAIVSRPIQKSEIALCAEKKVEFVEVPIALDAIAVVVNRLNGFATSLSVEELKLIWGAAAQGKITRWKQVRPGFPDTPLKLLAPDAAFEGGNTFTEAVLGPGQRSRRDYMVSVDDNVLVQGVMRDPNTLGYISLAYYGAYRQSLKAVPIAPKAGAAAVEPSLENVANGSYRPFTRPLFLYASVKALEQAPVREFAEYAVANGARFAEDAGLAPLAQGTYKLSLEHLRARNKGTAWDGSIPISPTQLELQKRMAAL